MSAATSAKQGSFYDVLHQEMTPYREKLNDVPVLRAAFDGTATREQYLRFLEQAYHHVKHTVPLMMAAGSRLRPDQHWLLSPLVEYSEEENGHDEWILKDIENVGGDAEAIRNGQPGRACELFVSYVYDRISRVNPLCVFGMVYVLEGTSIRLATDVADRLCESLGLERKDCSYLYSHGSLDLEHFEFFKGLMGKIDRAEDQADILHTAKVAFDLYIELLQGVA